MATFTKTKKTTDLVVYSANITLAEGTGSEVQGAKHPNSRGYISADRQVEQ